MRNLRLDQTDTLSLMGRDHKGNPIAPSFDSPPVWASSDGVVAGLSPASDVNSVIVMPAALGTATISVTASIGGNPYTASIDVTVTPGAIVGIDIVESISP